MSWVAVGAAAVTVVGGAVTANNKPKAPQVAGYTPVDLQQQQKDALEGNLASQSSIEKLLAQSNTFQQGQAVSLANQAMPGYSDLAKTLTSRAQGLAEHPYDVPKEVQDNLARIAAERGISAGTRGQFNDFSLLRDFGVNSLQYGASNLSQASQITNLLSSIAPKVNPMSPLSFYVTPEQNAANTTQNNQTQQGIAQSANNANAAAQNANTATWNNLINGVTGLTADYLKNRNSSTTTSAPTTSSNPSGFVSSTQTSGFGGAAM
jgi:hypothetical protein